MTNRPAEAELFHADGTQDAANNRLRARVQTRVLSNCRPTRIKRKAVRRESNTVQLLVRPLHHRHTTVAKCSYYSNTSEIPSSNTAKNKRDGAVCNPELPLAATASSFPTMAH